MRHTPLFSHVRGKIHVSCTCGRTLGVRCDEGSAIHLHAEHRDAERLNEQRRKLRQMGWAR